MSTEAEELKQRASDLRLLADDVESLLDSARSYVSNEMQTWEGPNQEEVSGALSGWNTECGTVAGELRGLATSLDNQADQIEEEEEDEGGN